MKPTKQVVAMVIDGGGEMFNFAARLAEGFAKVRYCFPLALRQPWPTIYQDAIGNGMGVEQVLDWYDYTGGGSYTGYNCEYWGLGPSVFRYWAPPNTAVLETPATITIS